MERAELIEECPEVARIALASAGRHRDLWLAAFALDGRIGRMVLGATEPMLGQIRLAWWRDQFGQPVATRPEGDPLLDLIGRSWEGRERALRELVDGWEALLSPRPLSEADCASFVAGRASLARALAESVGSPAAVSEAKRAGTLWGLADLAIHAQEAGERSAALDRAAEIARKNLRLPRTLRPLSVIGGLARRSLKSGGRPFLGDRVSPFIALRLGLFGR